MDAEKILSDILEDEVYTIMTKNILDEYTTLSEEKKREIVRNLQRRSDDKMFRSINDLTNDNIHKRDLNESENS